MNWEIERELQMGIMNNNNVNNRQIEQGVMNFHV